jgi:cellulose synthase/poly-beta-1,6-N-acetylglucosamine synthase-like glycosyltransferase
LIIEILEALYVTLTSLIMIYWVRHYIFTLAVLRKAKKTYAAETQAKPTNAIYQPTVTILIPAHNEEAVLPRLLSGLTGLIYPQNKLQAIVIDDASTDNTGKIADEYASKNPFIQVLHRDQKVGAKGKSAALNAGLAVATGEVTLCFDADYTPQTDIAQRLVQGFADLEVGAVQGRPVVINEPKSATTRLVALERMGGYRVDQEARSSLGLIPQFGGTVGGFRTSLLKEIGGFDEKMLTEDTDLTFELIRRGYKIRYIGDAECYEEAVDNLRSYWRQRHRWARGHMQVCFKHSYGVLMSKKMTLKEKVDGLLLLHLYFMPIVTLLSLVLGTALILKGPAWFVNALWFSVPVSFYSFIGNFAPFFEVSIGAYLDGRKRAQWLIPLLLFAFIYNIPICLKALFDLCIHRLLGKSETNWAKTTHGGENLNVKQISMGGN